MSRIPIEEGHFRGDATKAVERMVVTAGDTHVAPQDCTF